MISIKEAIDFIKNHIPEKRTIVVPLADSINHVSAEDLYSPEQLPGYTNCAMDGYAVRWEDVKDTNEDNPSYLEIIGESSAGNPFNGIINPGQAIIISTGAMLPDSADTVVPVENTEVKDGTVTIRSVSSKGRHVRYEGEELKTGELIVRKGELINPARIALLGLLGIKELKVFSNPKVAILTTGSELVPLNTENKEPWQIRDSNRIMLEKAIINSGGKISFSETVVDSFENLKRAIIDAEKSSDIIIVSGGVSVGRHDHVKSAAIESGFEQLFWKVNQKPGKPLFVAVKENCIVMGLPGNPVSALNCYAYYVHPVIMNLQGKEFVWENISGILAEEIVNKGSRSLFCRVKIHKHENKNFVIPISGQGSHKLTTISEADGFIIMEPESTLKKNENVELFIYPWGK